MTQICVALVEETTAGMVARMAELAPLADLFEIRADRVIDLDLLTILRARTRPLVLTCRPVSQGGAWDDADPRRRMTLLEGVKRRFDYVDIELRSGFLDVMVEKVGEGLILSHHDVAGMPDDLDGLYREMTDLGADIAKIVVTPHSIADVGRLLECGVRSEEHTSELQSHSDLVCRLLLEKKKRKISNGYTVIMNCTQYDVLIYY